MWCIFTQKEHGDISVEYFRKKWTSCLCVQCTKSGGRKSLFNPTFCKCEGSDNPLTPCSAVYAMGWRRIISVAKFVKIETKWSEIDMSLRCWTSKTSNSVSSSSLHYGTSPRISSFVSPHHSHTEDCEVFFTQQHTVSVLKITLHRHQNWLWTAWIISATVTSLTATYSNIYNVWLPASTRIQKINNLKNFKVKLIIWGRP